MLLAVLPQRFGVRVFDLAPRLGEETRAGFVREERAVAREGAIASVLEAEV